MEDGMKEVYTMKVQTTRFGQIEVDESRILKFPKGLLGFPDNHDYALLQTNEEGSFFWLQSVDRSDVAFVVCDPLLFVPDYQVQIRPEDCEVIGLEGMEEVQVLIIVNKVDRTLTGNLQGPLVINALNRLGRQSVLSEKKYSTRHPLIRLETPQEQVSKTA
jgi:flagellar assembly factor FliW